MYRQLLLLLWQLSCSQGRIIGEIFSFRLWSSTSKPILKLKEVIGLAELEHLLTVMNFYFRDVKEILLTMKDTHSFLLLRKVISKQYFKRTLSTSDFKSPELNFLYCPSSACQVGDAAVGNVKAIFLFPRQCSACLIVIGILSCCLLIISHASLFYG